MLRSAGQPRRINEPSYKPALILPARRAVVNPRCETEVELTLSGPDGSGGGVGALVGRAATMTSCWRHQRACSSELSGDRPTTSGSLKQSAEAGWSSRHSSSWSWNCTLPLRSAASEQHDEVAAFQPGDDRRANAPIRVDGSLRHCRQRNTFGSRVGTGEGVSAGRGVGDGTGSMVFEGPAEGERSGVGLAGG